MTDKLRRMKDRASRMYADGKLREALELYERIVSDEPSELQCQIKVGDLHRRLGDRPSAIAAYEEVARRYAEDGLLLKAIAVCKLILVADKDHTATQAMLADLYARRKAGSPTVPSLPLREPQFPNAAENGSEDEVSIDIDVVTAWPSGTRLLEIENDDMKSEPAQQIMSAWPTSQPVIAEGKAWPIVQGRPAEEGSLELEITDAVGDDVAGARLPAGDEEVDLGSMAQAPAVSLESTVELSDIVTPSGGAVPAGATEETFRGAEVDTSGFAAEGERQTISPAEGAPHLIPLFSDLPKKAFVEILVRMTMHELRRGEVVVSEGDNGDSFYVIASGLVSVSRKGSGETPVRLAHLGEGAFFGEMALLQNGARTATVQVEEDAQIFEISRTLLEEVIGQYPTVATAVRNFYRQRLLATAMATHALFAPFDAEERRALMEQFKSRSFAPEEVILEEGKKGNGLYLLLHGRVQVTKTVDDETVVLAELKSGDIFGEMSLLTNHPTNATITALEDAFVLRLSKKRFDELVLSNEMILDLVSSLSERRTEANEKILSNQLDAHGAVLV